MMSNVQTVNELARPVEHENSKALSIMAVPDQMAGRFLCGSRQLSEEPPELPPAEAKYGTYYLSASRLNFGGGTISFISVALDAGESALENSGVGNRCSLATHQSTCQSWR
jgi:hypothetical protein